MPLALVAGLAPAAWADDPIRQAFDRLYNFDFSGAHRVLDAYQSSRPGDPMGYSLRAAVYLFAELDRLGVLESEFLADDRRIARDHEKRQPDPALRAGFSQAVEAAQSRARQILAGHAGDPDALCALCMSYGEMVDYTALIEKRTYASLSLAKRSHACARQLLRAHPDSGDAYVTVGFTEYLVGSLPFFVRWFVRFEGVEGSKQAGIAALERAARSGRYLAPFAKILLSIAWLREKNPEASRRYLAEFHRDYPENPLVRRELAKLTARVSRAPAPAPSSP